MKVSSCGYVVSFRTALWYRSEAQLMCEDGSAQQGFVPPLEIHLRRLSKQIRAQGDTTSAKISIKAMSVNATSADATSLGSQTIEPTDHDLIALPVAALEMCALMRQQKTASYRFSPSPCVTRRV